MPSTTASVVVDSAPSWGTGSSAPAASLGAMRYTRAAAPPLPSATSWRSGAASSVAFAAVAAASSPERSAHSTVSRKVSCTWLVSTARAPGCSSGSSPPSTMRASASTTRTAVISTEPTGVAPFTTFVPCA